MGDYGKLLFFNDYYCEIDDEAFLKMEICSAINKNEYIAI